MNCCHQNPASPDSCDRCDRPEVAIIRDQFRTLASEWVTDGDGYEVVPMREALDVVRSVLASQPTVTYRPDIETR